MGKNQLEGKNCPQKRNAANNPVEDNRSIYAHLSGFLPVNEEFKQGKEKGGGHQEIINANFNISARDIKSRKFWINRDKKN